MSAQELPAMLCAEETPKQCRERTMSAPLSGRINVGSICAITMAIFAIFMLSAGIAHAQFLSWPQYTFWPGHYAPFKHKHHHRQKNHESAKNARPEDAPKGPLQIIISVADQRVSLFDHGALVARASVSPGTLGHSTPLGVFSVISKQRWHRSNIYSAAPMPFMQRITWSGIAMHLGVVPGHPASHGCIRLPAGFAAKLWGLTKIGERVVISPREVTPIEFTHPLLPAPKMRGEAEADQAAPDAPQAPLAAAQPPLINPHQYAEQLRAKAVAERAAAVKTVKETYAAVRAGQQEAARAAAELKAAEAAHSSAQAKADTAAKAYQAAVAAASAKEQEPI